jgi:hypothetical protein
MTEPRDPETIIRSAWQSGPVEKFALKDEEMHARLSKLQRRIKWRNIVEYAAGLIVLIVFTSYTIHLESVWMKIGSALSIMATVFVLTNLHFRAGLRSSPVEFESRSFYISELERQRDALKSVWLWYLLPFAPGAILFRVGVHLGDLQARPYLADAFVALIAVFVIWLNRKAARRLQRNIDEARQLLELTED